MKHTLVTVRQLLESRNWLGIQCLINTHSMKKASDYFIVTWFHLWPLSTSETFSPAAIIMYKSYLELENYWISYRFCFFSVYATRLNGVIRKNDFDFWLLVTLTCGYISVVSLSQCSTAVRTVVSPRSKSMGSGHFGMSELRNPWTDWLKIWHTWLRLWADLICQIS